MGVLVALQSRINSELAGYVGGGLVAAAISFGTGLILAGLIVAARPMVRAGLFGLPAAVRAGRIRVWQMLGGLGGAWLVTTQGIVVPVVGVTIYTIAVVAGQVTGSLGADRAGLSPAGVLLVTGRRSAGALVALAAVAVSGLSQATQGGSAALWAALLAVSAGLGISVQQAINGRVSVATGEALAAATVNFIVGMAGLTLAVAIGVALGFVEFGVLPQNPLLYIGGPIGVAFIALAAWAVRALGVLTFGLLAIAGQLLGSVLVDLLAPSGQTGLGVSQVAGLVLVLAAVWLVAAPVPPRRTAG